MHNQFWNSVYLNFFATLITLAAISIIYFLEEVFFIRKIESKKQKQKMRIRSFYIACVIFIFLMAHIWVNGFMHLLTILGLVSAALVVTNKETIMNFVGWLIITWRGLFLEEDLIQIQQYKGYVKKIGVLYVSLYETSDLGGGITGRVIRIPNGLVSTNPIINFSQSSHLLEQRFILLVSGDNDFAFLKQTVKTIVENVLTEFYRDKQEFSSYYLLKKNKNLSRRIRLGATVSLQPKEDNLSKVNVVTRYFCFSQDAEKIQERLLSAFLKSIKKDGTIQLAV